MTVQLPSERAHFLASLIEAEGLRYGREDSFKMSHGGLLTERFLLGIPLHEIPLDRIMHVCNELGMPQSCRECFLAHLNAANLIFFGVEDDGERGVYKVYLEFWDEVRLQVLRTGRTDPLLLNLGFKWYAGEEDSDVRVARYTCYPCLSVYDILGRIQQIYADGSSPAAHAGTSGIIRRSAEANPSASFLYVEVSEKGNPRKSFDVKLYKANLSVADIQGFLSDLAGYFCIPAETFSSLLQQISSRPLGHLSGGRDKDGRDFVTAYYETCALED
jgi:hypothetical protein